MDILKMAMIILLSLTLNCMATAQLVTLTSNLLDAGKSHACPNQVVTFTCEVTGESIVWYSPDWEASNAVKFLQTNRVPTFLYANIRAGIGVLLSKSPTLISILRYSATISTEMRCFIVDDRGRTVRKEVNQVPIARVGDIPSMPTLNPVSIGNLSAYLCWTSTNHSGYDFLHYEVDIFFNNVQKYMIQVRNTSCVLLSFDFGMNGEAYTVMRTITGCPDHESARVQSNTLDVVTEFVEFVEFPTETDSLPPEEEPTSILYQNNDVSFALGAICSLLFLVVVIETLIVLCYANWFRNKNKTLVTQE